MPRAIIPIPIGQGPNPAASEPEPSRTTRVQNISQTSAGKTEPFREARGEALGILANMDGPSLTPPLDFNRKQLLRVSRRELYQVAPVRRIVTRPVGSGLGIILTGAHPIILAALRIVIVLPFKPRIVERVGVLAVV